jgi:hypothetical protein
VNQRLGHRFGIKPLHLGKKEPGFLEMKRCFAFHTATP